MSLDHQKIIVRPIFTEKMSRLEDERKYCFQVQLGANKVDIKKAVESNPDRQLSIRSDTDAPFGKIIKVMDAAKLAGVKGVKAFTRESSGK